MTIARLRLGPRHLSFSIGFEPADNDQAANGALEQRVLEQQALAAHEQRRSAWEAQMAHLGRRPA